MMRSFGGKRSNAAAATTGRLIAREAAAQRLPARTSQARPMVYGVVRWNWVVNGANLEDRSSAILTDATGVPIAGSPRLWIDSYASCQPVDFGVNLYTSSAVTVHEIELTGESVTRNGTARPKARALRAITASQRATEVEVVAGPSGQVCLVRPLYLGTPLTVDVDGTGDNHSIPFRASGLPLGTITTGYTFDVPPSLRWAPQNPGITGDVPACWAMRPEHELRYRAGANDHQGGSTLSIDAGEPFMVQIGVDLRDSTQTNAVRRATVFLTVQFEWTGVTGIVAKLKAPGGWCSGFDVGISGATFTGTLTNHGGVGLTGQRSSSSALTMGSSNSLTSITSSYGTIGSITLTPTQDATTGKITAISCAVSPSGVMDTATISWQTIGGRPSNRSLI